MSSSARMDGCVCWRSEAFAEDLLELGAPASGLNAQDAEANHPRWSLVLLPVLVALVGMAFAVVPPLG